MNKHRDVLLKILDAIGYQDNKESFVSEFEKNIQLQALDDLIPQEIHALRIKIK